MPYRIIPMHPDKQVALVARDNKKADLVEWRASTATRSPPHGLSHRQHRGDAGARVGLSYPAAGERPARARPGSSRLPWTWQPLPTLSSFQLGKASTPGGSSDSNR